ncbi:MAG: hypothetical protein MK105_19065 [Crocinitomicaceae bacterium]|nr:hypothetical protein [Crocinitomicaceae bacterium]
MNKFNYPQANEPEKVGSYDGHACSGGGFFYDEVLEYRVWCHPEGGAPDKFNGDDYFYAFNSFEEALDLSKITKGAEEPLVLVKQLEWVNEPEPGVYIHEKTERITEWLPAWLEDGPRKEGDVESLVAKSKK